MQGAFTLNSFETIMTLGAESTRSSPLNVRWTAFPVSIIMSDGVVCIDCFNSPSQMLSQYDTVAVLIAN